VLTPFSVVAIVTSTTTQQLIKEKFMSSFKTNEMLESKMSATELHNGGIIELWAVNGLFYVKSIVAGVVKFSEAVSESKANYFVFDAQFYGNLDF
jgi:hypothetical protein